jgi:hypothetical protein
VTVELSSHFHAHLQLVSPPQLLGFVTEQVLVLLIPNQHCPAAPQR